MRGAVRRFGDGDCLVERRRAGAMIADVQIDQHVDADAGGVRGLLIEFHMLDVIGHHHRAGFDDARNFLRLRHR